MKKTWSSAFGVMLVLAVILLAAAFLGYDNYLYRQGRPAVFGRMWMASLGNLGQEKEMGTALSGTGSAGEIKKLQDRIDDYLRAASIPERDWIETAVAPASPSNEKGSLVRKRTVLLPETVDSRALVDGIPTGGLLTKTMNDSTAVFSHKGTPVYSLTMVDKNAYYENKEKSSGRVAVVIDDCGYGGGYAERFLKLPAPVSFAVLPYLPHTKDFALSAAARGHQVLLHLPMEPLNAAKNNPGRGAIMINMTPEEVQSQVTVLLGEVPGATGVNNHMGSRATSSPETMKAVMSVLRGRGLFYLDSWTAPTSVALSTARSMGIPTGRNEVFLDNVHTQEALMAQLEKARRLAASQGEVICIGHATSSWTLYTLEDVLPRWQRQGIQLVPVSELLR